MNSAEVRALVVPLTGAPSSCKITSRPKSRRRPRSFWTAAKPHTRVTARTLQVVEAYFQIAARTGTALAADGVRLDDGQYLQPDCGVMNSALHHDLVELDDVSGTFGLTAVGWHKIKRA